MRPNAARPKARTGTAPPPKSNVPLLLGLFVTVVAIGVVAYFAFVNTGTLPPNTKAAGKKVRTH